MKYTYEIIETPTNKILLRSDGASIPFDEANSDYAEYLESLEPKAKAPKVVNAPVSE
jgi:hypothetical protein